MTNANLDHCFDLLAAHINQPQVKAILADAQGHMADAQKAFAAAQNAKAESDYQSEMQTAQYHEQRAANLLSLLHIMRRFNLP